MKPKQELLILDSGGGVAVHTPRTFPIGAPIPWEARRLGVDGPSLVRPPKTDLSAAEFDQWRRQLEEEGYTVTLGPFRKDPVPREQVDDAVRRGKFLSLEEFRDELLGRAGGKGGQDGRRLEPVQPPAK